MKKLPKFCINAQISAAPYGMLDETMPKKNCTVIFLRNIIAYVLQAMWKITRLSWVR